MIRQRPHALIFQVLFSLKTHYHLCLWLGNLFVFCQNPGFYITDDMSVELHLKNVCRSTQCELRRISTIRHLLSVDSTKVLVSAFVLPRLNYCNSFLSGCPEHRLEKL